MVHTCIVNDIFKSTSTLQFLVCIGKSLLRRDRFEPCKTEMCKNTTAQIFRIEFLKQKARNKKENVLRCSFDVNNVVLYNKLEKSVLP